MKSRSIIVWFSAVSLGLFGITEMLEYDTGQRNIEVMSEMVNSLAYESQAKNPNFHDGKNLQLPMAGTIARGYVPHHFDDGLVTFENVGEQLKNPFPGDSIEILQRGEKVFQTFCFVCHGPTGLGDGPVTKRGVPPPPSLLLDRTKELKDGQIYYIITIGKDNMPPHASQIDREDRWKVIHYVRSLQGDS